MNLREGIAARAQTIKPADLIVGKLGLMPTGDEHRRVPAVLAPAQGWASG